VLMDSQMPGVDGLEAARAIRASENGRRATIVAVTAGVAPAEIDACLEAGMDACLSKPFTTVQLSEALARVLPPERAAAPPALDVAAIERLRADVGDDAALLRITSLFADGLVEARGELEYAVEAGDSEAVRRVAHRLRSSSATFGAARLSELSRELEAVASPDARELIAQVERESRRVGDAIAQLRL
jgi:DNA-binding NarL/FixJ family response regulator